MIEVVHVSRSAVTLRVGKRSLRVFGEGHALDEGSPGWVIYSSEVKWDPPYHEEVVDTETRRQAIDALTRYFASKENPYTVE